MGGQKSVRYLSLTHSSEAYLCLFTPLYLLFSEVHVGLSFLAPLQHYCHAAASFEYNEAPVASHYWHGQVDRGHWFVSPFHKMGSLFRETVGWRGRSVAARYECVTHGASCLPNYLVVKHSHSCRQVSWIWPIRIYSFAFPRNSACCSLQTWYSKQLSALNSDRFFQGNRRLPAMCVCFNFTVFTKLICFPCSPVKHDNCQCSCIT